MSSLISVILPFYNAETTIGDALQSIIEQDFPDIEIIAVDDHSSDASREIVECFDDPRLMVVENIHAKGVVGAMETGVKKSQAGWIARMDADDISLPDRLSSQWRFRSGLDVVSCLVRLTHSCGDGMLRYVDWANGKVTHDDISNSRFVESPIINPTVLIKREAYESVGGYHDLDWAEDHDLWLRLLQAGYKIGKVDKILLEWRDSLSRLTRSSDRYGEDARMAMRAYHIAKMDIVKGRGVTIAGAGPIGKLLARQLMELGVDIKGFFEVNPRRIGERIHDVPVVGSDDIDTQWRDTVLLGAVGLKGGRKRVRDLAISTGRTEGIDFWSVC